MKKILILGVLVLAACGGSKPVVDPSSTTSATPPDPAAAMPATPAAPTAPATPALPATPAAPTTATAPATPATPATTSATPAAADATSAKAEPCSAREVTGKDLASCKADCKKLDDKAPAGSKCIPPRTACLSTCDQKFKK